LREKAVRAEIIEDYRQIVREVDHVSNNLYS
jgi:hypothetical protein